MFISENCIYLQMQKTGCTHIAGLLEKYESGRKIGKHNPIVGDIGNRFVISSIRNPWDWYVSLWAYGCSGRGGLHSHLTWSKAPGNIVSSLFELKPKSFVQSVQKAYTSFSLSAPAWRKLYVDSNDAVLFRAWLQRVLGDEGKKELSEGYPKSGMKNCAGFMTYRFLRLSTRYEDWTKTGLFLSDYEDLRSFVDDHYICSDIIRIESLEHDLSRILGILGHSVTAEELSKHSKSNQSAHRAYSSYYDAHSVELVRKRERLLIEKFNYDFEGGD